MCPLPLDGLSRSATGSTPAFTAAPTSRSQARARSWRELHRIHLSNSITDELAITFLAWGLSAVTGGAVPESTEGDLVSARVPFTEVVARVLNGYITDSMTVAAVLHVELLRMRGELPDGIRL